jgi:hypothetical protein
MDSLNTEFYKSHGKLIVSSYEKLTDNKFPSNEINKESNIQEIFNSSYVLLSHGLGAEPIFNFANKSALDLFEVEWLDMLNMPSRRSAEQLERKKRETLLNEVSRKGYIANYSGIRISAKGTRFLIKNAVVWNLIDEKSKCHGQAAMFNQWEYL